CGPCCSVAPSGMTRRLSGAALLASVRVISTRRRTPPRSITIWIADVENHALDLGHEPDRFHPTHTPNPAALARPAAEWCASVPIRRRLVHVHDPALEPFRDVEGGAHV